MQSENETNVTPAPSSSTPAKNAATSAVDELAGGAPGAPIAEAKETPVSTVFPPEQRAAIVAILDDYFLAHPVTLGLQQLEDLGDHFDRKLVEGIASFKDGALALAKQYVDEAIENAKADMLKHFTALASTISQVAPAAVKPSESAAVGPHELAVGDPVLVWVDKKANTFRLGEIAGIHDGAHAFDVKLDDGTVTKIPADGLQFDDRR